MPWTKDKCVEHTVTIHRDGKTFTWSSDCEDYVFLHEALTLMLQDIVKDAIAQGVRDVAENR